MNVLPRSVNLICLDEEALYKLVLQIVERIEKETTNQDVWISPPAAMKLLNIKSKTTLSELRNNGKIRYSQPQRKLILYDRMSILEYLDQSAKAVIR